MFQKALAPLAHSWGVQISDYSQVLNFTPLLPLPKYISLFFLNHQLYSFDGGNYPVQGHDLYKAGFYSIKHGFRASRS